MSAATTALSADDRALRDAASTALEALVAAGFEHAQAGASRQALAELCIAHNEASLLRSTDTVKLSLMGILGGRMATTELGRFDSTAVREAAQALVADARSAPQDDAYAVSAGEHARVVQGPLDADPEILAISAADLLAWRAAHTPRMMIDEGEVAHRLRVSCTFTTSGSELATRVGEYTVGAFGTAREGKKSSSFNYTGGATHDLRGMPVERHFGIDRMLRDTERQIDTHPIGGRFTGDVVLTPSAVDDLVSWLLGQLGDMQLIAGTSLYREKVGAIMAAPAFTLKSRFDAPGVAAVSADGFAAPAVTVVDAGRLNTLLPTLYGSRKTGLPHVATAAAGGWEVAAGDMPLAELVGGVKRGALVGRFSMGMPAANGDFSGVIKNSFVVDGGEVGTALSETMVAGNMARMLEAVVAVSRETIDTGATRFPWVRIEGLHFS